MTITKHKENTNRTDTYISYNRREVRENRHWIPIHQRFRAKRDYHGKNINAVVLYETDHSLSILFVADLAGRRPWLFIYVVCWYTLEKMRRINTYIRINSRSLSMWEGCRIFAVTAHNCNQRWCISLNFFPRLRLLWQSWMGFSQSKNIPCELTLNCTESKPVLYISSDPELSREITGVRVFTSVCIGVGYRKLL